MTATQPPSLPPPVRRRTGGRSARVTAAVYAAVMEILAEHGYNVLSIAEVAQRAGVHDTSIYRRWTTKARLVAEAVVESSAVDLPPPDTGSFQSDIAALLRHVVARLRTPLGRAVSAVVGSQEPDLIDVRRTYWTSRQATMRILLERAHERGEIPVSLDPQFVFELLVGPIFLRQTSGRQVTHRYIDTLVERLMIILRS